MKGKGIQLVDSNDTGLVMDVKVNPIRDADGKIISGEVIGDTLQQNKALILITQKGEFKFRPDLGVGIGDLLLSDDYLEYRHIIRRELQKDGMKVTSVELYENKPLNIIADYGG